MTEHRTTHEWVLIHDAALDAQAALDEVSDERAGAIDLFAGVTRRWTGDNETSRLEYDSYAEMAVSEILALIQKARAQWPLLKVVVHHRVGRVKIGEASVLIAASTAHRADAFEGVRFLIDELKKVVPIWKREHYAGGSEEWVQGDATQDDATQDSGTPSDAKKDDTLR